MSISAVQSYGYSHNHNQAILSSQITPQSVYRNNNNQAIQIQNSAVMSQRQPTTPPRTPRRAANDRQAQNAAVESATESASESQAKPKSTRRNNRARNPTTTPAGPRTDRATPQVRTQQSSRAKPPTTTAITAYAGPTFHASPAPSALPIPSFFSKPASDSPGLNSKTADVDQDSSSSGDSPPLVAVRPISEPRREESPLDIFFNADRREKERARNAQAQNQPSVSSQQSQRGEYVTPIQGRCRPPFQSAGSGSRMLAMEMDGTPGKPYGPAFSTPYSERISAARSAGSNASSPMASTPNTVDRSDALKSYLFNGGMAPSPHSRLVDFPSAENTPSSSQSWQAPQPSAMNNYHGSPQQLRTANYGYNVEGTIVYPNGFRNVSRSSGLRQEVTHAKTPVGTNNQLGGGFQSPQSYKFKENAASGINAVNNSGAPLPNNQATPQSASRKEIQSMEDRLREVLKIGQSNSGSSNGGF